MIGRGAVLAERILAELRELSVIVERAGEGWARAREKEDDFYLDGVALNLHGFYSGLEKIFEKIATDIAGPSRVEPTGIRNCSLK